MPCPPSILFLLPTDEFRDSLSKKQSFSFYSFHWISAAYRIKSKYFIMSYACVLSLCESMDSSPPGSSVHGILQARILEGAAISSYRGSSRQIKPASSEAPALQVDSLPLSHGACPLCPMSDSNSVLQNCQACASP